MNLLESLEWRYATKKMNGEKIPQDKLETILKATKLAPSSYGLTPYSVIVVEDQKIKEELQGACYGQSQLKDSSAVLVFATWDDVTEGSLSNMTQEQKISWAQRQAYIGLGFALVAAATEGVDSTPMEGFNPLAVDRILGLQDYGLMSVVVLPLGYRDSENDYLSNAKKVRRDDDMFFIRK
jgi:nitroreductase/dihydropteridine reductase